MRTTARPAGRVMARRVGAGLTIAGLMGGIVSTALPAAAAVTPPPSAIGNAAVFSISVSPAYTHTGLVVAVATPFGTPSSQGKNMQLWVSHDGGHAWALSAAAGWLGGRPTIAVDASGREAMYAAGGSSVQRSGDGGATWTNVGAGGGDSATPAPTYAHDGNIAVAAGDHDYVLGAGGATTTVAGSGKYNDFSFVYSPGYPSGGAHAPALLSAIDSNKLPVILTCNANLGCSGGASLPGAGTFSAPATLAPSSAFASDGTVFAQSGRGIYKSIDGGNSFVPLTIVSPQGAATQATPSLALAPGYAEHGKVRTAWASILAVYTDPKNPHTTGGVYRSDDGGATWAAVGSPSPLDGGSQAVAVAPDGRLFASYLESSDNNAFAGLLCSVDRGASWQPTCPPVGVAASHPAATLTGPGQAAAPASCAATCAGAGANPSPASDGSSTSSAARHAASQLAAGRSTRTFPLLLLAFIAGGLTAAAGALGAWLRTRKGTGTVAG